MIDYAEAVIRDCEANEDRMYVGGQEIERETKAIFSSGEWDEIAKHLNEEQISDLVYLVWTWNKDNGVQRAVALIQRAAEEIAEERVESGERRDYWYDDDHDN